MRRVTTRRLPSLARLGLVLVLVLVLAACGRKSPPPPAATAPSASAAPVAAAPAPPPRTPAAAVEWRATTSDGVVILGSLVRSPDADVPVVLLVHRWAGSRDEWAPLVDLLARHTPAPHVATLDLRGHGASTTRAAGKTIGWAGMKKAEFAATPFDLDAAIAEIDRSLGAPAPAFVLTGSDLGAAVSVLAAAHQPRVVALALVSPGAALQGLDLYMPAARVRDRIGFLAGAETDNVAHDPVAALASMAKQAVVKQYPGGAHGAERLGAAAPALWQDLTDYLTGPVMHLRPAAPPAASASAAASPSASAARPPHAPKR